VLLSFTVLLPKMPSMNAGNFLCLFLLHVMPVVWDAFPGRKKIAVCLLIIGFIYAQQPIISFGQGCEGEPLLAGDTIAESIRIIRQKTDKGTINLNTNGSIPKMVSKIIDAGLDSIRISLASAQPEYYHRYHRPINYNFKAVKDTIKLAKEKGIFTMINYLVFPGLSDTMEEINALKQLVAETHLDLIQLKNLNIDPFWYIKQMQIPYTAGIGIKNMMEELKKEFPELKWGYFNQYLKNG